MSVTQDASGRRSTSEEFDVPGTPDEVWAAIATGPGISAWFVPAEFEELDGRPVALKLVFGADFVASASITAWEPPHRYVGQNEGWGGSPPIATEWEIEARGGGTCHVRIVHSLFASTADWDDQLEGAKAGWSGFLAILKIYLAHFRGQPFAMTQLRQAATGSDAQLWDALISAVGLRGVDAGQRFSAPADAPSFAGVVEYASREPFDALLRVDQPGPGIVALGIAGAPGGPSSIGVNLYFYGAQAKAVLARETPAWAAWLAQRFPAGA